MPDDRYQDTYPPSAGIDNSTLDSRMSSTKVPQMELLQINYVHRRKQALMPLQSAPPSAKPYYYLESGGGASRNCNFVPIDANSSAAVATRKFEMGAKAKAKKLPLPPPTVESWHLLQKTREACADDCEKSYSWNYRAQKSPPSYVYGAGMGLKSRAERIARIEVAAPQRKSLPMAARPEEILRINQMFQEQTALRLKEPPLPQAPLGMKEPNMRRRPVSCAALSGKEERYLTDALPAETRHSSRIPVPKSAPAHKCTDERDKCRGGANRLRSKNGLAAANAAAVTAAAAIISKASPQQFRTEHAEQHSLEQKLLRSSRYHRVKAERVHLRKQQRQPLHILNELTAAQRQIPASAAKGNCQNDVSTAVKRVSLPEKTHNELNLEKNKNACSDCTATAFWQHAESDAKKLSTKLTDEEHMQKHNVSSHRIQYADPNDVQNFAKKNLIKTPLNNDLNNKIHVKPKQCNIENDLKNHKYNNSNNSNSNSNNNNCNNGKLCQRQSNLPIDDNWIHEVHDTVEEQTTTTTTTTTQRKPINANDNCVKIFVRSADNNNNSNNNKSTTNNNSNNNRCSPVSFNSCSSSASTTTSASSSSSSTAASCSVSTYSGYAGSNVADSRSICGDSDTGDCCCDTYAPCNAAGVFFNHHTSESLLCANSSDTLRACASSSPSPSASPSPSPSPCKRSSIDSGGSCSICLTGSPASSEAESTVSTLHCAGDGAQTKTNTTAAAAMAAVAAIAGYGCDATCGMFWNNAYYRNSATAGATKSVGCGNATEDDGDDDDDIDSNFCYCSLSSCDEDNCSYYESDWQTINKSPPNKRENQNDCELCCGSAAPIQKTTQHLHKPNHTACKTKGSSLLLHKQKLLRKAYVMHELRPRSMEGAVDSGVSLNGDNGSSPDGSEHMENQQDTEGRRLKRGHVLTELLETERIYVNEMNSILKGYCAQMQSDDMSHLVPASLKGKEEILFGNLHELYTFHSEVFLRDLENCISTTELVALCFVQRRDTFYRLYSVYCQNIPRSDRLRETLTDAHFFLQECQKRLGHKLPLGAYLLKPVQRITKYQLLLKDLLRFSDSGSCTKELQRALDCMLIVLKCVNDSMHQVAITGFPNELSQLGDLLLQDSFQVWSESKKDIRLRIKPQQRHIFLYRKSMLFCKQLLKPGHNKSTYQFKHHLKMSQIGLTESIRGDTKRFEVWLQGRQEVHTLQAPTIEIKNKWVTEIKRVLLNQLEELKDEKIKQYGLSHVGLRQHGSWDASNIVVGSGNLHNINCDGISSSSSNRNSNCSSSGDDNCSATAISRPSIEREQQEACGWSSDYSNSEDELSTIEDNSTPGSKLVALADYTAITHSEVSMHEGDNVELLKVGCGGWWYIRVLDANVEGWAPAAYLESQNRKAFRNSQHSQEPISQPKANE